MLVVEQEQTTNIRFGNVEEFETYIKAKDVDYNKENTNFIGWLYKLNTPQCDMVNRSQLGRGTSFKQDFVE